MDEFLDQYTGVELEKMEKKDPSLRQLINDNEVIEKTKIRELLEKSLHNRFKDYNREKSPLRVQDGPKEINLPR